jgi:hypothetical protein
MLANIVRLLSIHHVKLSHLLGFDCSDQELGFLVIGLRITRVACVEL